jgi:hypothetical protein
MLTVEKESKIIGFASLKSSQIFPFMNFVAISRKIMIFIGLYHSTAEEDQASSYCE